MVRWRTHRKSRYEERFLWTMEKADQGYRGGGRNIKHMGVYARRRGRYMYKVFWEEAFWDARLSPHTSRLERLKAWVSRVL